jgi:hypothetical protein
VSRSTLRFLGRQALEDQLWRAGLRVDAQFGDFDGRAVGDKSAEIITIARNAA